jgi:hypothetical protein
VAPTLEMRRALRNATVFLGLVTCGPGGADRVGDDAVVARQRSS